MAIIRLMKTYSRYLVLALLLYTQNIIFSFFAVSVFIPSLIELVLLFFILLLLSYCRYQKLIISLWLSLYLMHFSFMSYFGQSITPSDIYLFFTHVSESYETFIDTLDIFIVAFSIYLINIFIVLNVKLKKRVLNLYTVLIIFIIAILLNFTKLNDASFLLLKSISKVSFTKTIEPISEEKFTKEKKPLRESEINIVLLIGESMRAKEYQLDSYEMFEKGFYKTIYSGGTSTDVSIPLLINGAIRPSQIDMTNNLFRLAKQNSYQTQFITTQSLNSMKYIKPYMDERNIDRYSVLGSREDSHLLDKLKKIDFNNADAEFVVMQMQGEHSPYKYYPTYVKSTIPQQYAASMEYSNTLILEMMSYIGSLKMPTLFIFTSDHGELLNENGRAGHNKFHKKIYRVPMIIMSNINTTLDYEKILSHQGIYNLIYYFLGYAKEYKEEKNLIRVNGSMISEEDGFRMMESN